VRFRASTTDRIRATKKVEFNYLFVVDIFNEGVGYTEIDTVLFLRPTESLTVFFFNNWDVVYV
jgi:superfamily II DNA or RNA helicase